MSCLAIAQQAQASPAQCDRACLAGTLDKYIAALVAHDPSKVAFASDVKFVENTQPMKPGEGLWKTASAAPTTFKIYVPDTVSEEIGFIGVMKQSDKPIQIAIRLKIRDGKITEAEHLIAGDLRERSLKNLETPRPVFLKTVPPSERMPRAQMIKVALTYYTALVTADANNAPFADDCLRHENGMQTTGNPPPAKPPQGAAAQAGMGTMGSMGCAAQLKTGVMNYIKAIEPRRVEIADPQTGLVFGLSQFRQPMVEKTVKITGVPGVTSVPVNFKAFDLPAAHIFKVDGGKIHEIEAMGTMEPYNAKTGWEKSGN
jgi:hypothetical protein